MKHAIATRDEWLEARKALLAREKALTRERDAVNRERLALPWVRIDKNYVFETEAGPKTLSDLFDGRSQLIVLTDTGAELSRRSAVAATQSERELFQRLSAAEHAMLIELLHKVYRGA